MYGNVPSTSSLSKALAQYNQQKTEESTSPTSQRERMFSTPAHIQRNPQSPMTMPRLARSHKPESEFSRRRSTTSSLNSLKRKVSMHVQVKRSTSVSEAPSDNCANAKSPAASFLAKFYEDSSNPSSCSSIVDDGNYLPGDEVGPYVLKKEIGYGATSKVFEAETSSSEPCAVKIIRKTSSLHSSPSSVNNSTASLPVTSPEPMDEERLDKEASIWSNLSHHPNIIRVHDIVESNDAVFVISEIADGGNLLDAIRKHPNGLDEDTCKKLFRDIVFAVHFMHQSGFVHRDIKLENILLCKEKSNSECDVEKMNFQIERLSTDDVTEVPRNVSTRNLSRYCAKLADFGLSDLMEETRTNDDYCVGSLHYCSPEEIKQKAARSASCDIWSLGCVLFAMLTGRLPFQDDFLPRLQSAIVSGKYHDKLLDKVSPKAQELVKGMLAVDVEERWKMEDILNSEWLIDM